MKKIVVLTVVAGLLIFASPVAAQFAGVEVTSSYQIADDQTIDGDILISTGKGLVRTNLTGDARIFGVLQKNPVIVFRSAAFATGSGEPRPVMRSGVAIVNVTDNGGAIAKGDAVTTSTVMGKGEKAAKSGYTLGIALADWNPSTGSGPSAGRVPVAVKIEYTEISSSRTIARFLDLIGAVFFRDVREPGKFVEIMRNIAAALVVVVSFFFAFITFSRSVPKAIEAIGRNPLARRFIYLSMITNIGLILGTILIGILAAVLILRVR